MSLNISSWSIRKPIPTLVLFMILAIVGLMSFMMLGIDEDPNIDVPIVSVTVTQQGAGPVELETQVTKKVEDAVASLGDIEELRSTVKDGVSTTTINFDLGTDSDRATNDVRNAIAQIRQDLPSDVEEPVVQRVEFIGGAIMSYVVSSPQRSIEELSDLVDRKISRYLLRVPGVSQINRIGGVDREIRVDLNPQRLEALGITATEVNDQIRAFNINLPGGRSELSGTENSIRTLGSAKTVEALRNYRIVLPNGGDVVLSSLGEVKDGSAEPRQRSRFTIKDDAKVQQETVVGFSVLRSTGSTLVTVEEGVRAAVKEIERTLPPDISINLIFTRGYYIRESYQASIDALVIGSILTVITVGLFLRDWRATLITGLALPLSIVPTFMVMRMLGYTLNSMTLLALALAMGNLVDDAICMIENIAQHLGRGKKPFQAALDASKEIGLAVLATTATIVAVFVPVAFMGGIPGQFFQPFGLTVAISTMFSTLVATTMTPMLAAYLLKGKVESLQIKNGKQGKRQPYISLLSWALRHRSVTLLLAVAFFIGSLQLVPLIPKGLFSGYDRGLSTVSIILPPGATLNNTDRVMQQTTSLLQQHPIVENILGIAGEGKINEGILYVNLTPRTEREISQKQFEQEMRPFFGEIPGARIGFQAQGAAGANKDLQIVLKSENPQALRAFADALERYMRSISGLVEVNSSASLVKPEILITPDPARAADLGVSVQAIARTASLATIGDNDSSLAKFDLEDRQIPIRVQLAESFRNDLETLKNIRVPSQNGGVVPLLAVADVSLGSGPAEIERFDRARKVSVEGNLQGISLGQALDQVNVWLEKNLPEEVEQQPSGDAKIMRDIFTRFGSALGMGVLCIYAILVLLYNNFIYPFTIMVALPLSLGGALLALMITQKELGLFAVIGIVLLMGLVTKNAILLVDCSLANMKEGSTFAQRQAIKDAGVSRLRPILMTTFSTIAGMTPIALELGAGGQVRSPMAISVIGGIATSTMLTLVVVPTLFTYVDSFQRWLFGLFRGGNRKRPMLKSEFEANRLTVGK
ncbi:MAG: efflux RND transporter permease subunit [Hormoscilla sp.]